MMERTLAASAKSFLFLERPCPAVLLGSTLKKIAARKWLSLRGCRSPQYGHFARLVALVEEGEARTIFRAFFISDQNVGIIHVTGMESTTPKIYRYCSAPTFCLFPREN